VKMRHGSIYLATNTHTGEQYVGQTRQLVQKRWDAHWRTAVCSTSRKAKFQEALSTFGQDAFQVAEVFVAFDADALNAAEIALIAELQPAYNATRGGKGLRPITVSEETKRKRSDAAKARWSNPQWRAKTVVSIQRASQTPEAKDRGRAVAGIGNAARWAKHIKAQPESTRSLSEAIKASWQDPLVRSRRIENIRVAAQRPESKQRYSDASRGRTHSAATVAKIARTKWKPVYCRELQCSFLSQKAAAEYLGVLKTSVANAVKQKGKVARTYTLEMVA
jgi:group I intron endonuclease